MKVLVTSGGTKIKIDMVRSITNMSKGTFGAKICKSFVEDDKIDEVIFLMAKDSKKPNIFDGKLVIYEYVTFEDYAFMLDQILTKTKPDVVVLAAAVSDYGVENFVDGKIRSKEELVIRLKPLPKLISTVRLQVPKAVICGFKLLVNSTKDELLLACRESLEKNNIDLVVGNDLRDIKANNHQLTICEMKDGFFNYQVYGSDFILPEVVVSECKKHARIKDII